MKFIIILTLVAAIVCSIDISSASRSRRAISKDPHCLDSNLTDDQCHEYAAEVLKKSQKCQGYTLKDRVIEWQSCGSVVCAGPGMKKKPQDLSKSYPDCCPHCHYCENL